MVAPSLAVGRRFGQRSRRRGLVFARGSLLRHVLIITSPSGPCIILSIPLGPSEVLRILDTDLAAAMLARCASIPFIRFFFSCSRRIRNGLPYSSKARLCIHRRSKAQRQLFPLDPFAIAIRPRHVAHAIAHHRATVWFWFWFRFSVLEGDPCWEKDPGLCLGVLRVRSGIPSKGPTLDSPNGTTPPQGPPSQCGHRPMQRGGKGKRFCGTWKDSGAGAGDPLTGRAEQDRARRGTRASFGAPIPRKPTYPVDDVSPAFDRSTAVRAPYAGEEVPPGIRGEPSFQPNQLGGIHVMPRFG